MFGGILRVHVFPSGLVDVKGGGGRCTLMYTSPNLCKTGRNYPHLKLRGRRVPAGDRMLEISTEGISLVYLPPPQSNE
jgi:hypothetical protein